MTFKNYSLIFITIITFFFGTALIAQKNTRGKSKTTNQELPYVNPKLVVGIVVDQMRYDYLTRFWDHYGNGGFKRLVEDGFNCKNNHFNYAPTSTGPGHASIYTGTTPATHGIMGNVWYDKKLETQVYCVSDDTFESIGASDGAGQMSPHRLLVTTITDELRLHTQMQGKVIAVAIKDRGAVLPAGHTGNAGYWFPGGDEGNWITSSYYMSELPDWVNKFNATHTVDQYKKPWTTLEDISTYVESGVDNNEYESVYIGESAPVFPHNLPALWDENGKYDLLKITPYGNNITTDFALAALRGENLGSDEITDFLAISFSSTDYVGHKFGVNAKEVQDTYVRLDRDIDRILKTLDKEVGTNEYVVFLTSDHGAIEVPSYLKDQKIPAGYLGPELLEDKLFEFLKYKFGTEDIIKTISDNQIFLNHKVVQNLDLSIREVQEILAAEILNYDTFEAVYTGYQMQQNEYTRGLPYILQNGYDQKRSGDILLVMKPGFINYPKTGSTHGSSQIYDTHVPLLFFGKGIKKGSTTGRTEIPDIAPTMAVLLGIAFPNGTTGSPISEVLE